LEEAPKLAQRYFNAAWIKTDLNGQIALFTFHLTENDAHAASADIKNIIHMADGMHTADEDIVRAHVQAAFIARELKETEAEQAAVKEIRRLIEKIREKYVHMASAYSAIADVLEGKPPTDEALTGI